MAPVEARYPTPDRSRFTPNRVKTEDRPEIDIGWDTGIFNDGRPYRAEVWAQDQITMLTVFLSTEGLEQATSDELAQYLEQQGLVRFVSRESLRYVQAHVLADHSGQPMWSINVAIADEDARYAWEATALKTYPIDSPDP